MIHLRKLNIKNPHAKKRLFERYGINGDNEFFGRCLNMILTRRACLETRHTNTKYIYSFLLDGIKFYVVYHIKNRIIITFLTKEMFEETLQKTKNKYLADYFKTETC